MYNKILFTILFLLSSLLFTACKKQSEEIDINAPTIDIDDPTPNDTYPSLTGDCHMEFTATDDVELSGILVNITNMAGTNFYSNSLTIHSKTYDYHDHLVVTGITSVTPFILKITVTDKSGSTVNKTIPFYLKP
jgi:hypothetical protein